MEGGDVGLAVARATVSVSGTAPSNQGIHGVDRLVGGSAGEAFDGLASRRSTVAFAIDRASTLVSVARCVAESCA